MKRPSITGFRTQLHKKKALPTLLCFAMFFICTVTPSAQSAEEAELLIINSYHPTFPWTESIVRGISSTLAESDMRVNVRYEYLDTKRYDPSAVFPSFLSLFQQKYAQTAFDVLIVTDDNALDFIFRYGDRLFPDVPVVFCGINAFSPSMTKGLQKITGIVEDYDIRGTIDLALSQFPDTERIAVISDVTPSDAANRDHLDRMKPEYAKRVRFIDLIGLPASRLKEELRQLPDNTVILFFNFYRDCEGTSYTLEQGMEIVYESCNFPIYSLWRDKVESGALGGVITSGLLQGEHAAKIAIQIIRGTSPGDIPVMLESSHIPMFHHKQLQRFGIPGRKLPKGSIVLNKPNTFFYNYRSLVFEVVLLVLLLLTIIVVLWFHVRRRKKSEAQLRRVIEEKDFLMKELNHRVKNNLAIISSLINLKDSSLGSAVDLSDFRGQIDAIRIVHEILYQSNEVTHINLREYFQNLLETIFSSFTSASVRIENRIENKSVRTKTALSLGLILNELATNAIKYGFTGIDQEHRHENRFSVELHEDNDTHRHIFIVSNTGRPFPEEIDLDNPKTLGLRLISALVGQLEGTIELQRSPHPVFTVQFPIPES